MAFVEDTAGFLDVDSGFAFTATLAGVSVELIFDAPGAEALDGSVITTEPSVLCTAVDDPQVGDSVVLASGDLPAPLVHHAGTYTVRSVLPESPDGSFVRAMLVRAS